MDWNTVIPQLLGPLGTLVLALVILGTGIKQVWLFRWTHDLVVKGKDDQIDYLTKAVEDWRDIARSGTSVARQAVTAVADSRGVTT